MFDNIGGKIKGLAMVVCWIGIIASVIGAIALWVSTETFWPGFGVLAAGAVSSWLGSLFTYGFGEIIDQLTALNNKSNPHTPSTTSSLFATTSVATQSTSSPVYSGPTWTCSNCKEKNPISKGFCTSCGTQRK
ncbi:MAG: hypothetical protein IJX84_00805 [Clostridia bacterium]|nr:hypothetical protein [Clostridia bacterium]